MIQSTIKKMTENDTEGDIDLILTSGGTGYSQRDVTPESIEPLLIKKADSLLNYL